jgi:phage terminase small subunit
MKLSEKQQLFVNEYLIDFNATKAAIRAGYSEKTAYSQGPRLLDNVEIQKAIEEAREKTIAKLQITREDVLRDLIFIKEKNIEDWPPHSLKALEMINKMLGFNEPDKQEITLREEPPLFNDDDLEDGI